MGTAKPKEKTRKDFTKEEINILTIEEKKEHGLLTILELKTVISESSSPHDFGVVMSDLVQGFTWDYDIGEACTHAGIARDTYYRWLKWSDKFSEKMESAKHKLFMAGKKKLAEYIVSGNPEDVKDDIKWLLTKRQQSVYSSRSEITGADGESFGSDNSAEIKAIGDNLNKLLDKDEPSSERHGETSS